MSSDLLPADGEPLVGSVRLPAGARVPAYGTDELVAWVTLEPVPDAGRIWLALSGATAQTGLQPLLWVGRANDPDYRPGDDFLEPHDVTGLDDMDAAALLARGWGGRTLDGDLEEAAAWAAQYGIEHLSWDDDPDTARLYAPYGETFPGLAPATSGHLPAAEITRAVDLMGPAHLCLVQARRPADVLPLIGWQPTDAFETALPVAAVLRSWEDRFGARLLRIGPSAELRLLVERPPRTTEQATAIAAEHLALSGTWIDPDNGHALTSISDIAPRLVNNPLWGFWWD